MAPNPLPLPILVILLILAILILTKKFRHMAKEVSGFVMGLQWVRNRKFGFEVGV